MNYYSNNLNSSNLEKCYSLAPRRVRQYLSEEINYVASRIKPGYSVLELGCGYGRIVFKLADLTESITGIDISDDNIEYARKLNLYAHCTFRQMDALSLDFEDNRFDMVICLQNGICAFHTEKTKLVQEALRVTKSGGTAFFSSYGKKFWPHRLEWFEIQASHGLLGKIDYERSINNTIVCKDGFSSGAMDKEDFLNIAKQLCVISETTLVDNSSLICNYAKC
ncbi:MAG: class I SAM-dependent methyltransferase [Desulfobacula sp.]|nr:class I SAM-dependent methyltransferase [Desulfobacula sp.]